MVTNKDCKMDVVRLKLSGLHGVVLPKDRTDIFSIASSDVGILVCSGNVHYYRQQFGVERECYNDVAEQKFCCSSVSYLVIGMDDGMNSSLADV